MITTQKPELIMIKQIGKKLYLSEGVQKKIGHIHRFPVFFSRKKYQTGPVSFAFDLVDQYTSFNTLKTLLRLKVLTKIWKNIEKYTIVFGPLLWLSLILSKMVHQMSSFFVSWRFFWAFTNKYWRIFQMFQHKGGLFLFEGGASKFTQREKNSWKRKHSANRNREVGGRIIVIHMWCCIAPTVLYSTILYCTVYSTVLWVLN